MKITGLETEIEGNPFVVFTDLHFAVKWAPSEMSPNHAINVTAYNVIGWVDNKPQFQKANSITAPSATAILSEAEIFLSGDIRWDGCSNWRFDCQDNSVLHFCKAEDGIRIGQLFAEIYDFAEQVIPNWEG